MKLADLLSRALTVGVRVLVRQAWNTEGTWSGKLMPPGPERICR